KQISVRVRGDRVANDTLTLRDWALAGLGIMRREAFGIRRELASGKLVTALDAFSIREANLYAITTGGLLSQRVSTIMEFLEHELLSADPARRGGLNVSSARAVAPGNPRGIERGRELEQRQCVRLLRHPALGAGEPWPVCQGWRRLGGRRAGPVPLPPSS